MINLHQTSHKSSSGKSSKKDHKKVLDAIEKQKKVNEVLESLNNELEKRSEPEMDAD